MGLAGFSNVEDVHAGALRAVAALAVAISAAAMAALPVAFALGAARGLAGPLAVGLGGMAAAVGVGKWAAAAWGLSVRISNRARRRAVAVSID